MLTFEEANQKWNYDPISGILTWKVIPPRGKKLPIGTVAGSLDARGYLQINTYGKVYKAHRIAWLLATGELPKGQIDHINQNRIDNRLVNLRVVNNQENSKNHKLQSNNTSGLVGVSFYKRIKKWRSYITINRKQIHLGFYEDMESAINARKMANIAHGFHANHGSVA